MNLRLSILGRRQEVKPDGLSVEALRISRGQPSCSLTAEGSRNQSTVFFNSKRKQLLGKLVQEIQLSFKLPDMY